MTRYRPSIETEWTPDEAFVYLSDFSTSVEWDPSAVAVVAENATVISRDRISFETIATGTRVTYDAHSRLKDPRRLADPLLALAFTRIGDPALAGLREVLGRSASGAVEAAA